MKLGTEANLGLVAFATGQGEGLERSSRATDEFNSGEGPIRVGLASDVVGLVLGAANQGCGEGERGERFAF